jgi:hypothetical protein
MNINIDVYEIATQDEIKGAVLDALKSIVIQQFSGTEENLNRLITNLSYRFVWEMVNRQYDGKLDATLRTKISEVINSLSPYTVFSRKDAWQKEESVAYKALQEEMANSRPLIKSRVEQIISEYPFNELKDNEIGEVVYQCVMDRLFKRDEA